MVIKQFAPSVAFAPFIRAYEIIETRGGGDAHAAAGHLHHHRLPLRGLRDATERRLAAEMTRDPGAAPERVRHRTADVGPGDAHRREQRHHPGEIPRGWRRAVLHRAAASPLRHYLSIGRSDGGAMAIVSTPSSPRRRTTSVWQESSSSCWRATGRPNRTLLSSAALRAIGAAAGAHPRAYPRAGSWRQPGRPRKALPPHVGASPKQFATIVRVRQAVELSRREPLADRARPGRRLLRPIPLHPRLPRDHGRRPRPLLPTRQVLLNPVRACSNASRHVLRALEQHLEPKPLCSL